MNTTEAITIGFLHRLADGQAAVGPLDLELTGARAVLRQLPTVYFNLLHLYYIRGLSIAEVARKCGCPEGAVIRWHDQAVRVYARQLQAAGLIASLPPKGRKQATRKPATAGKDQIEMFSQKEIGDVCMASRAVDNNQAIER